MEKEEVRNEREYSIVKKSNEIVQKAKYNLSTTEIKIMNYLFTMVRETDTGNTIYDFPTREFIKICGIEKSGTMYKKIRDHLEGLVYKGFWLYSANGKKYATVQWINKAWVDEESGTIEVRLDEDIQKYVKGLINQYTAYPLLYILPMKSKYSIRLYELLKSYSNLGKYETQIDYFKQIMECENYTNFKDVRRYVIEKAIDEINEYSDIHVKYETKTKGRKVIGLIFTIRKRSGRELENTKEVVHHVLDKE